MNCHTVQIWTDCLSHRVCRSSSNTLSQSIKDKWSLGGVFIGLLILRWTACNTRAFIVDSVTLGRILESWQVRWKAVTDSWVFLCLPAKVYVDLALCLFMLVFFNVQYLKRYSGSVCPQDDGASHFSPFLKSLERLPICPLIDKVSLPCSPQTQQGTVDCG